MGSCTDTDCGHAARHSVDLSQGTSSLPRSLSRELPHSLCLDGLWTPLCAAPRGRPTDSTGAAPRGRPVDVTGAASRGRHWCGSSWV